MVADPESTADGRMGLGQVLLIPAIFQVDIKIQVGLLPSQEPQDMLWVVTGNELRCFLMQRIDCTLSSLEVDTQIQFRAFSTLGIASRFHSRGSQAHVDAFPANLIVPRDIIPAATKSLGSPHTSCPRSPCTSGVHCVSSPGPWTCKLTT